MAKLISGTYGEALFELAVEEDRLDSLAEEIQVFRQILSENEDLKKLLNHPKITKDEKLGVMENIFKERISGELMGLLSVIITKDRCRELDKVLEYFLNRVKEARGIGVAYVTTVSGLSDAQKGQIVDKLLATTGYRRMEMHYREDKDLIGGMVIRIGDRVVDSSIRTKLEELQKQLMKIQLG